MSDRRLQIFAAVARHKSFTKAADSLFMSQPAVTVQVRQLEDALGVRLVERGGRGSGVSLTPAGEIVQHYARQILLLSDEMEARLGEIHTEVRGTLQIGAPSCLSEAVLPRLLSAFNEQYPLVRARLISANTSAIEQSLLNQGLDVAFSEQLPQHPRLKAELCAEGSMCVACAPGHPLAKSRYIGPKSLSDYEYLAREPGSATRMATDAYFAQAGVEPAHLKTLMELGSCQAQKSAVLTGLGFAILPTLSVAAEKSRGELATVTLKPPLRHVAYIVYPEDRFQSQLLATFIAFVREKLPALVEPA